MAATMKTHSYKFLEAIGIEPSLLEQLKGSNIKIALNYWEFILTDQHENKLTYYKLAKSTNELMKPGAVTGPALEVIKGGITKAITDAIAIQKAGGLTHVPEAKPVQKPDPMADLKAAVPTPAKKTAGQVLDDILKPHGKTSGLGTSVGLDSKIVKLINADKMYQAVYGTSTGSRYYVVGMVKMGVYHANVAARIQNSEVSVRVEGNLSAAMVEAFSKVGIASKGDYLSGHFTCNANAPAARVLGAILMGTGLEFATPMPLATKVTETA
jgi:hypothetical protein